MLPSLHRVGVLANPADPFTKPFLEQVQLAGRVSGIDIGPIAMVGSADEVDAAFADMVRARAQAVVVQGIFFSKAIADLAIKHRLPAASVLRSFAQAGGLVSYGAHTPDIFRRSATLVHKILQGAKPADLPVEQPTKFELVINLKTVALGKARERRIRDESVKLLKEVQPVKFRPGQSLAGRPVASVASRRATGGCEAYTARKQAARVQLRHLI